MSLIRLPHLAAALVAGLVGVSMAQADVVLKISSVSLDSPASATDIYSFVTMQLTNGTPAPSLLSMNAGVTMTSSGGTGASIAGAEYGGGPFPSTDAFSVMAGDTAVFSNDTAGVVPVSVADGDILLKVKLHLDPGAVGTYDLTFDDLFTSLYDGSNQPVEFITSPGTLTITPEPASLGLLGIAGLGLLRRRSR